MVDGLPVAQVAQLTTFQQAKSSTYRCDTRCDSACWLNLICIQFMNIPRQIEMGMRIAFKI